MMPLFSLPGDYGIGDLGACAYRFADEVKACGARIWQMLPLNPLGYGHSPYQPFSSAAGEPLFIDLGALFEEGLIAALPAPVPASSRVDYDAVTAFKEPYFREAYGTFRRKRMERRKDYRAFLQESWVYPFAVFAALKKKNSLRPWNEWPEEAQCYPERLSEALKKAGLTACPAFPEAAGGVLPDPGVSREEIGYEVFLQYLFFRQFGRLRAYARGLGLLLMGDIPFYCGHDSVDVWMNRDMFLLDSKGFPTSVAGVPPDYFSATGQRWGNPIYDWAKMEADGFTFLKARMAGTARLFDIIRIDHFRAFDTFWKIPASCPTAIEGAWIEPPGYAFFDSLLPDLPGVEIVAEDLGMMRKEVYELRDHYGFPGMDVVEFTLTDPEFEVRDNMVVYTGTHDNDTVAGWWESLKDAGRDAVLEALCDLGFAVADYKDGEPLPDRFFLEPVPPVKPEVPTSADAAEGAPAGSGSAPGNDGKAAEELAEKP
ncbi:MAG: 4-alpha-glucanotransferase, partial [Lachnospiraceae bacterium]|nr:4-alpha-glucanotransferase [Lachnospiraceae bacterium]